MSESKTKSSDGNSGDALPEIDFVTFILSLATSALMQLGEHEDGTAGGPVNLPLAKQTIDMISMLREKTRGNLAPDETHIIESALYKLRMRFLEVKPPGAG
jgi:hypothetical protein